jgi:hypothetical protein
MADNTNACKRARRALSELCGDGTGHGGNTIYLEVIVSQGRRTQPDDFLEVEAFVEDVVLEFAGDTRRSPKTDEGGIFAVSGEERPGDPSKPGTGGGQGRIHTFIRFDDNTLGVGQLDAMRDAMQRKFDDSDVGLGRGLDAVNVVDKEVVMAAAPERTGPPMEDVEFL